MKLKAKTKAKVTPLATANDNDASDGVLGAATPQQSKADKKQRKALLRSCAKLAKSKDILALFDAAIHDGGLVGEHRNARLIFLAMISCLLDRPVSIAVKGASSGGKNTLVKKVLNFFPDDAYHPVTGMSDKALAYLSEPLKHRMLFISEASGLKGDDGLVLLRNLLSEGYLKYTFASGKTTRTIMKEGPTGLITTTTDLKLYHDDETRLFSIDIANGPVHSSKVLDAIAAQAAGGVADSSKPDQQWRDLTCWLASKDIAVVVPFAPCISKFLPRTGPDRLFRDFKAMLALVRAHALLHQWTRERDDYGAIIATVADYKAVRLLVKDIIAQGIDARVSDKVRKLVDAVSELSQSGKPVSAYQLCAVLDLHRSNVLRSATEAIESGFLRNLETREKYPARYVPGEALPLDRTVLPTSKLVAKKYRKLEGKKKN